MIHFVNEYLAKLPFDIYELNLFHLIAQTKNFTKAAQQAGLTQSAITRQIAGMEASLGIALFERTTRHVALTAAGQMLFDKSKKILDEVGASVEELQQAFQLVPQVIRIGVSRSIGLAYLPGFFSRFQKQFPKVQIHVTHQPSHEILQAIEARELDVGLLCPPPRLSRGLQITHRFSDDFTLIIPKAMQTPPALGFRDLNQMRLLTISRASNTGKLLDQWLRKKGVRVEPAMELDNFDLIVNLVGLGMGISLVPHRALPLYLRRRAIVKMPLPAKFSRQLVVVIRKNRTPPKLITDFVEDLLF